MDIDIIGERERESYNSDMLVRVKSIMNGINFHLRSITE